jgi:hypothetical protein
LNDLKSSEVGIVTKKYKLRKMKTIKNITICGWAFIAAS